MGCPFDEVSPRLEGLEAEDKPTLWANTGVVVLFIEPHDVII